jgi:cell wall-associated NlpC family hydrolase
MSRGTIARGRVTVPIACSLIATVLPFSAATADAVSSNATLKDGVVLYQDATQDASSGDWVDPATTEPPSADVPVADQGVAPAPTEEWVEPLPPEAATDPASTESLGDAPASVDPATGDWVEPAPVDPASSTGHVDPATGEWIDPTTVKEGAPAPVDAAPVNAAPVAPAPSTAPEPPSPLEASGTEPVGAPIATAYIAGTGGDGAPCLAAPDWGAAPLAHLGDGEPVEVRAETMGEWQPVNCAGAGGYVHAALIAWTPGGRTEPAETGGDQPAGKTGSGSVGEQIASFALQFQGYPYIYAGEGPYAFDCSGFTMFVIRNTLGIEVPHDMRVQYQMGLEVNRDALQPGDLVFFANTLHPGMSHNGIYIGGGQFIHAETESAGVKISDLASEYYSSRWYGAVRFV